MQNILETVKKFKVYILSVVVTLGAGLMSAIVVGDSFMIYQLLNKPPLSPPAPVFSVVWTLLYVGIGIALAMVIESKDLDKSKAVKIYFLNLAVNIAWPIFFFKFQAFAFSVVWIILVFILGILTFIVFRTIDKKSSAYFIPYLIWVAFALYLNFAVVVLNS